MAKRDLILYYLQVQDQYFEMLENVKEFDELYKQHKIDEEQFHQAQKDIDIIKTNYERLSYELFLLNKPKRKSKQLREKKENKKWYDYLKGNSKEAILDESKDALADFKKLVSEVTKC